MAEFDPQEPAENQKNQPAGASDQAFDRTNSPWLGERQWELSSCDAGGCGDSPRKDYKDYEASRDGGTEYDRAEPGEPASTELVARTQPESFWVDLVKSQQPAEGAAAKPVRETIGTQSTEFWSALVQSQQPSESDEASDWQPLRHEQEPVSPAAEPVEVEASADRADVAYVPPQSTTEEWESARSEAQDADESKPTLMAAAVEAAQGAKAKKAPKAKAAKKPAEKKVKSKKTTAAKKPAAKKAAKRPAAKKVAKKAPPPRITKITKAPTRRAA